MAELFDTSNTVFVLDSYGLIFREYYALMSRPLTNKKGENISALFGFFRNLRKIIEVYNPRFFAAAMDSKTKTFRHEMFLEYKANRSKTPDDLHAQVPWIEDVLSALGVRVLQKDGFEADDIIATVAKKCREEGRECRILSGDKDLMQLVGGGTEMLVPAKFGGGWQKCASDEVAAAWGVPPEKMLDILTLTGDSADNVPGVKGIGLKTAQKLLSEYGSLDGIFEHSAQIKGSIGEKIRAGKESADLSRRLIRLCEEVPLDIASLDDLRLECNFEAASQKLFDYEVPAVAKSYADGLSHAGVAAETVKNKGDYKALTDVQSLREAVDETLSQKEKIVAFDTETTSLDTLTTELVGFSLAWKAGAGVYVPLSAVKKNDAFAELSRIFSCKTATVVMHNGKFDYEVLISNGFSLKNASNSGELSLFNVDECEKKAIFVPDCKIFDTMVAAWILQPDELGRNPFALETLSEKYLHLKGISFDEIVEKGKTFADVPLEKAAEYCAEDSDFTLKLFFELKPKLAENGLLSLFENTEMRLLPLLSQMEIAGIHLDSAALKAYHGELSEKIVQIQQEIFDLVGHEFNIASTKQLQQVLFEERGLKAGKKTKTGFSTDTAVMEELALVDPVPAKILEYRAKSKLLSTYVDALPELADAAGRVHTTFLQTGTATGRLSSRDPNLQNIPVRDDAGRRIRSAFTAEKGTVLISADYAQIELVVLAHLSGDEVLQKSFRDGTDVHRATAALIYGTSAENVTSEMRRAAKTINFGIIYGMSAFRLAKDLGISRTTAKGFIDSYFAQYPKIREFIAKTVADAEKNGFVETLFHRRRYIQNIKSANKIEKAAADRVAVNTPIQGTAADIVKLAMIAVDSALKKDGSGARILLQVHDELIVECPETALERTRDIIKREMENAVSLSVPLRVSIESGKNWGEFH